MIRRLKKFLKLIYLKYQWKKNNKHNQTWIKKINDINSVIVGNKTFGAIDVIDYLPIGSNDCKIKIGNYCSIATNVKFLRGGEHSTKKISTFLFKSYFHEKESNLKKSRDIIIGDDVWIGYNSLILPGTVIGQGAIIGAGSVARGNIEPYSIYVGDKVIRKRFNDKVIERLLKIDYSKLTDDIVKKEIETFSQDVNEENVEELIKKINNNM